MISMFCPFQCSLSFPEVQTSFCYLLSVYRNFFSDSLRVSLLAIHSLNCSSSENVLIFSVFLKVIFTGYRIQGWLFFLSALAKCSTSLWKEAEYWIPSLLSILVDVYWQWRLDPHRAWMVLEMGREIIRPTLCYLIPSQHATWGEDSAVSGPCWHHPSIRIKALLVFSVPSSCLVREEVKQHFTALIREGWTKQMKQEQINFPCFSFYQN